MIEVKINVKDMPLNSGPHNYFDWLEKRLKTAGIPIEGDNLLSGSLIRLDDPDDYGTTIYRWVE